MTVSFWDNIVGQQSPVEQLQRVLERHNLPHALLFSGPAGVGKQRVARALAAALLTATGEDIRTEEKLRLLAAGNHPDFHFCSKVEDKKDITVESIRELCASIRLKPYYALSRVSIINDAHLMNAAASNALLMTLEEPCDESYLILVSHAPQRLPATILSRCQIVNFAELDGREIEIVLRDILGLKPPLLENICSLCAGSLEVLEIKPFLTEDGLRVADPKALEDYLEKLSTKALSIRQKIEKHLRGASTLHTGEIASFANFLAEEVDESPIVWKVLHETLRQELRNAKRSDINQLAGLLELSLSAEKLVRERNVNPQLQLTSLLLEQLR